MADIVTDDREPQQMINKLSARGLSVTTQRLGVGDYVWGDTAVERKTITDFISSISRGGGRYRKKEPRIWNQAKNLADEFETSYIIISGTSLDVDKKSRYRSKSINGAIAGLQEGFGVNVIRVENDTELAELIVALYGRGKKERDRPYPTTKRGAPLSKRIENALCQADLVGIKTAKKALKWGGSLYELSQKSLEELQDNFGKKTGENIKKLLNEEVDYGE